MKKIIVMTVCIMFLFSNIVFADEIVVSNTATTTATASTSMKLTIAEAIAYAKENNYEILLAKIDEENMKTSKNSAKDAESAAKDSYKENKNNDNFSSYKTRNGYNTQSVKNQAQMLTLTNAQKQLLLEVSVETAYYNLSEKRMTYNIKKSTAEQINKQLENAGKKLELGSISQLEYKKVILQKGTSDVALLSAEADYKKAMMDFNQVLGLPLATEILLTDEVSYFKYDVPLFDDKLDELKQSDTTYVQHILDGELFDLEKRLTRAYYGVNSDNYKQLLQTEKKNIINFNHYKDTMEYNLIFDIINLNIAGRNIDLDVQSQEIAKITLDAAKQKYSVGLISDMDMITAELEYQSAELKYVQELHNYKIQVLKFEKGV